MTVVDQDRWRAFGHSEGPGFPSVRHIPGLVRRPEALEAGLRDAVRGATTRAGPEDVSAPRFRVYSGHRLDYPAAEGLTHSAFDGGDLGAWFDEQCPADEMCLAFNEVDTWSPAMADLLAAELTLPLVESAGEPRSGLEWYSFVGRSGFTPFGLHSDPEPSMIFHLGPAPKEVWVFDRATLPKLPNGRQITFDFTHLLPTARHFVLRPGDFLLIPAFDFHVFRNIGYSAFLGLTVYPRDLRQELANVVMHLAPHPDDQRLPASEAIRVSAADLVGDSFEKELAVALDDAERRLRSAAWTKKTAVPLHPTKADEIGVAEFVVTTRPVVPAAHRAALFVGGRTITLPTGCQPEALIDVLTSDRRFSGPELLDALSAATAESLAYGLFSALETCGGVRRIGARP
ncbi:hypothetical protein [Amycolatopsis sp. NPDC051903]|uniref:hypothetical protein n=1 Tax=Amycolatopsis sp. NPDC051903 TaxID=3363936 RepID=UPI0037BB38A6